MSTQSELNKNVKRLKYLYSKFQMLEIKYKGSPTIENKNEYNHITDVLDDELSKYYANTLFFLKVNENPLFETYLALKKQSVIKRLFTELKSIWNKEENKTIELQKGKFNVHTELKK